MTDLFGGFYKDRTVLITGHTGFKGSWLCYWLQKMGADVIGYSLNLPTTPNHYELLDLNMVSIFGDVRDQTKLETILSQYQPEIVFHLAAQPLVRLSYDEPVETFDTNVMGTLKVFEACRKTESVRAIVNITSDKAYENRECVRGYKEDDPMGGYDPYSASKGCAELVTSSYRNSYFNLNDYGIKHNVLLASCRAGNVIGGGDWGKDRLMTDIMLSVSKNQKVKIRNPHAVRPWQHVLESLSGYLLVGQKLLMGKREFAEGWNFGPDDENSITVEEFVKNVKKYWNNLDYEIDNNSDEPHEASLLKLDCSKAHRELHWKAVWQNPATLEKTVCWYKKFYQRNKLNTTDDLLQYIDDAKAKGLEWAN